MSFPANRLCIMMATKPVDFRKGHDRLAALVKNELRKDPFTGTIFVFRSRRAHRRIDDLLPWTSHLSVRPLIDPPSCNVILAVNSVRGTYGDD